MLIISGFIVLFSCDKNSSNKQYSNSAQKYRPPNAVKAPDFTLVSLEGDRITLSDLRGNVILLNFWATWCGPCIMEIPDLNKLQEKYQDKGLIVIGLPSNQFGGQEPGTNSEIKNFCEVNFNINFPMTTKIDVKGENTHPIYLWAKQNYGNSAIPKWNFHKILINKDGKIQNTYTSLTKPTSKKITNEIENILYKE